RGEAEVRGHGLLEARLPAASVLAPSSGRDRGAADIVTAAPVAGRPAERRKPRVPAVRGDADAVDPGPAYDSDPPAALGARTQAGERVVLHRHVVRRAA